MIASNTIRNTYPVYGHRLVSTLAILQPYNITGYPAIKIQQVDSICFSYNSESTLHGGRELIYHANMPFEELNYSDDIWALEIKGVVMFIWYPEEKRIGYIEHEKYTVDRLHYWLLHTFLPLVFVFQESYHLLHAAAVEIEEGKAILLLAPPRGGKSTLTHALIDKGYRFLGDDVVALYKDENEYKVIPSYPYCRIERVPESLGVCCAGSYVKESLTLVGAFCLNLMHNNQEVELQTLKGLKKFNVFRRSIFSPASYIKHASFQVESDLANCMPVYYVKGKLEKKHLQFIINLIKSIY